MTTYRHARNEHGDPVWIIEVVGWHDIYRVAAFFLYQQCEFISAGQRALRWSRRSLGAKRFEALNLMLSGDTKYARAITRASIRARDRS